MTPDLVVPASMFAMIFGIVYISIRKKERMALLEKGVDASLFESGRNKNTELKWGMMLVGVGAGILIGKIMAAYGRLGEEVSIFSMVCLVGGISLIIYHFIEKNG